MAFKDLREFVDGQYLDLPIDGRTYRVHDVDAETGVWAQKVMDIGIAAHQGEDVDGAVLDDAEEVETFERILGGTYTELIDAGVGWADLKRCAVTALIWIVFDEDTAEKFWESGGSLGEAAAPAAGPNRVQRRAASSVAARSTRSRASTSGTKARASKSATKAPSPGRKSSPSGR